MKKYIILFLQAVGIFVLLYAAFFVVPPIAQTEVYRSYINENLSPIKTSNKDQYLELLSSFNRYTYKKDELFTINEKNTDSSFKVSGYLVASNYDNKNNNGIFIYVEEASYKGEEFEQLALVVHYNLALNDDLTNPIKTIDAVFVSKNDGIRGFYISNYFFDNINFAKIEKLTFGILTSSYSTDTLIAVSDSPEEEDFVFTTSFSDTKIDLSKDKLSDKISNSENIPTDDEKITHNLYYQSFDSSVMNKYFYWYVLAFFVFLIIAAPIIYFGYFHFSLKERRKKIIVREAIIKKNATKK